MLPHEEEIVEQVKATLKHEVYIDQKLKVILVPGSIAVNKIWSKLMDHMDSTDNIINVYPFALCEKELGNNKYQRYIKMRGGWLINGQKEYPPTSK